MLQRYTPQMLAYKAVSCVEWSQHQAESITLDWKKSGPGVMCNFSSLIRDNFETASILYLVHITNISTWPWPSLFHSFKACSYKTSTPLEWTCLLSTFPPMLLANCSSPCLASFLRIPAGSPFDVHATSMEFFSSPGTSFCSWPHTIYWKVAPTEARNTPIVCPKTVQKQHCSPD